MNNATFVGRVGRDAVLRRTAEDVAVASFSLAVDQTDSKGERTVQWVDCATFGDYAEKMCLLIRKGTLVAVVGVVGVRIYKTQENEETRAALTLRVKEVSVILPARAGTAVSEGQPRTGRYRRKA